MKWPYERCDLCKREQRIAWSVHDEVWLAVMGKDHRMIVCLECFLKRADKRKINITWNDFSFFGWIGINVEGATVRNEDPYMRRS